MPEDVYEQIVFPPMPDISQLVDSEGTGRRYVDGENLISYFRKLEETIDDLRTGDQYISGDIYLPGDINVSDVVLKSLFDANTILKADVDDTPEALTVLEERIVGRITSGEITGLTAAQVRTFLDFDEHVDDRVAALMTAGDDIDITYNDGNGTLIIDLEDSVDVTDLTITGTPSYLLDVDSNGICYFQSQTSGTLSYLGIWSSDSPAQAWTGLDIVNYGVPGESTNWSRFWIGFNFSSSKHDIISDAGGDGTVYEMRIYTGSDTSQLVLAADSDNISMSGDLAVTGNVTGANLNITDWDNHVADNSQAHSDYLVNDANDSTSGTITAAGFTTAGAVSAGAVVPSSDNAVDIGATSNRWRDIYVSRNLTDDSYTCTVYEAYTAYTHSQDNTQAHSDYLLNDANDSTSGELTAAKFHAGTLTIADGSITDTDGSISFGDENLSAGQFTTATATFTGSTITSALGTISFGDDHISTSGNLTVEDIYHTGDADTTIGFGVDNITFNAGGLNFVYMKELFVGQDELVLNDGGVDIDTRVEAVGQTHALFVQGSDGRVGIGTSSPDSVFHIKAGTPGTIGSHPAGQLIIQNPTDSVFACAVITGYESDSNGNPDQQLWYLGNSSGSNSDIIFLNRRNSKLALGTNGSHRITILGNGNVGINETAPQDKLEVNGTGLFKDKLKFTQDDGNEYIASLNDEYMDYGATTGHRFNNDVLIANTKVLKINSIQVVGAQQAHIADSSTVDLTGTDSIDQTQLESDLANIVAAVNAALSALETHGLLAAA